MKAVVLGVLGLGLALVSQFALDSWADESDLHHWEQHGLLFWSGVAVGIAAVSLYRKAGSQ
ncbi:MAG TPA: hypothetical protein VIX82_11335 [Solirubrobacteraceae bacterium]